MTIRIRSLSENFRRCGMPHPAATVEYPDDRFTPDELTILKNEPMLVVEIVKGKPEKDEDKETDKDTQESKKK